jgi:rod shape-determining protein MreD
MVVAVVFLLVGVLLVVLQTTLLPLLPGVFGRPDLVYLLVAFAAYKLAWLPGILLAFTVGWIFDVIIGLNLGVYPLEFLFVFISLKLLTLNSPVKEAAYQIPMVGVSYFLLQMIVYFLSSLTLSDTLPEWSWSKNVKETLLLVVAAIPCFLVFNCLFEYLQNRSSRSRPARRKAGKQL